MAFISLLMGILAMYPYERVLTNPSSFVNERHYLIEDYWVSKNFVGFVLYPAGIMSTSLHGQIGNFYLGFDGLTTGKIDSYDNFGERTGQFSFNLLKARVGFDVSTDLLNIRFSINGIKAIAPDYSEDRLWADVDLYRRFYSLEKVSLGATLGFNNYLNVSFSGPYHLLTGKFGGKDYYSVTACGYYEYNLLSFLGGVRGSKSGRDFSLSPIISLRFRLKKIYLYYFLIYQKDIGTVNGFVTGF